MRRLVVLALFATALTAQGDVAAWLQELREKRDDVDREVIVKLGDSGTREAAIGLAGMFAPMRSVYMQREIVRALGRFANIASAEQPAFERLADIAANSQVPELREAAIEGLARSSGLGKQFLRQIVSADVPDDVRIAALQAHQRHATPDDDEWYRFLWNLDRERRKDKAGDVLPLEAHRIREIAFEGLTDRLAEVELIRAIERDDDPKIRRRALEVMNMRDLPNVKDMAQWVLERVDYPGVDRAVGARILMARDADRASKLFVKLAKKRDVTPEDLRVEMAGLLAASDDAGVQKALARLVGRGKPHEKLFALRAAVNLDGKKVASALRKQLSDRDPDVRRAAAGVLAMRGDKDAVEPLEKMLASEDPLDAAAAVDALTTLKPTTGWFKQLVELAAGPQREVRNAALEALAGSKRTEYLPTLIEALAHTDWSTRFVAIDGLVGFRDKSAVPALIARLGQESGRLKEAVADALWQLTGEPHEQDAGRWQRWWADAEKEFAVISARKLEEREQERELRRLRQRTVSQAKFFGLELVTHRVIFVIDSSGSMIESVESHYENQRGAPRIDVARQQLIQCIENLQPDALFNIYAFSSGIEKWQKDNVGANTAQERAAAIEWVRRLGAAGGTNLYDSLELAFGDPDVDTIVVLSDGEPSTGRIVDPYAIRAQVAQWNEHRKIKIHTVAIGGNLEILEWLARDAGGKHVHIR